MRVEIGKKEDSPFLRFVLNGCPWCKESPHLDMPLGEEPHCDGTWRWQIQCLNPDCKVRPKSQFTNFRKTSKSHFNLFLNKIISLAKGWNENNPAAPKDAFTINITKLANLYGWTFG